MHLPIRTFSTLLRLQVEREWRRKERDEAIKRAKDEEELNAARHKQIEDQRRTYACEIQREKEEAEQIAKLNVEHVKKSKETDDENRLVNIAVLFKRRRRYTYRI